MKALVLVFFSGFIFALGLGISGMTDANKVVGFLNLAGPWDPSLAFVMVGGIGVHTVFQRIMRKRGRPIFSSDFERPLNLDIERKLIVGGALFGVGWGWSGYCPGPAVVSCVGLGIEALGFTVAMLLGMLIFTRLSGPSSSSE